MARAVYPGSFDPVTNGHLDVIRRGAKIFDELVVAVADNPTKQPLFTKIERVNLLKRLLKGHRNIHVDSFDGLVVDFVRSKKCSVILRGIRTVSDFEFEYQMALTNRTFSADVETIFVMTHEEYSFVSSRLIKEAAALGGNISTFVPKEVEEELKKKLKKA